LRGSFGNPHKAAVFGRKAGRQIIVSTHSAEILSDEGIAPEEVLLLFPAPEGTTMKAASDDLQIRALLEGGVRMADAVLPRTAPANADQLRLFSE
jgi:hypothetical protein